MHNRWYAGAPDNWHRFQSTCKHKERHAHCMPGLGKPAHRKVCDHAITSPIAGGKTLAFASVSPYVASMNLIQLHRPQRVLFSDLGQLPSTAATLASCRHAALPASSGGMASLTKEQRHTGFHVSTCLP